MIHLQNKKRDRIENGDEKNRKGGGMREEMPIGPQKQEQWGPSNGRKHDSWNTEWNTERKRENWHEEPGKRLT